mmetsp:Transcript_117234/g.233626  ORF Transcript_117234/g.233626 Transcript_117234/m.233626 type:complete len:709 (+) Transcript_117234:55-2181(+)
MAAMVKNRDFSDSDFTDPLTDGIVVEPLPIAGRRTWRWPVMFVVATMVAFGMLTACSLAKSGLANMPKSKHVQPFVLMQDLRMLEDDHYLPYNPGKSKQENIRLAFNHFVATAMGNELNAEEKAIFMEHFMEAMNLKFKGNDHPSASQWKDGLKDAFEQTKPEITNSEVDHINSGQHGFTVSVQPWMKNVTNSDFQARLGVIQPPGPPPKPPTTFSVSSNAPPEFHTFSKFAQCKEVIRRDHNQGNCGSCWAFAAMSVIDSRLCIKTGGAFKGVKGHLSRTYATSCARVDNNGNRIDGCQGGWGHEVFNLAATHGIPTGGSEGCLPYFAHGEGTDHFENKGKAPPCPGACVKAGYGRILHADKFKFGKTVGGWYYSQDPSERTKKDRVKAVQQSMLNDGPVVAYVHCDRAFFAYKSGIYNSACDKPYANHAVTAIGFGGNSCPNGYGNCPAFYWELLNSWGDHWGNGGEMKVAACVTTSFDIPPPVTDSDVGNFPSPLFPGVGPAPSPADSPFEVTSGPCKVESGNCVLSPNWPANYGNKQECKIKVKKAEGVKLQVVDFATESCYDMLTVSGKTYSGSTGPMEEVAKGDIAWKSDYSVSNTGWKICEEPEMHGEQCTCDHVGDQVSKPKGQAAHVKCPSGCTQRSVWGSNPYTSDSVLCKAAAHAGLSGNIKVTFLGEKSGFKASTKNGVTTSAWGGSWKAMQLSAA